MDVVLRSSGVVTRGFVPAVPKRGGGVRGKIKGGSVASFRRLREFCMGYSVPNRATWGVCLSIGGLEIVDNEVFRGLHHKLVVYLNYAKIASIWRVELQQRGQPHLHLILHCSYLEAFKVMTMWIKWVDELPYVLTAVKSKEISGLVEFSRMYIPCWYKQVDIQSLDGNDFSVFRYLVAHTAKKSQLGWVGRQWGVVNRSAFVARFSLVVDLLDEEYYSLCRWLRRLTRFRGSCNRGKRQWLVDPNTVTRMLEYMRDSGVGVPF